MLTATVSPNPAGGTVTFYDSTFTNPGQGTILASAVPVNGSGQAQATVTFPASEEGSRSISAVFNGTSGFASSTTPPGGEVTELTVNQPYNPSSTTFCNGPISINNNNGLVGGTGGFPYPSQLVLGSSFSQLQGTIENVTLTLNGLATEQPNFLGFLLQAPNGNAFEAMSWADGSGSTISSPLSLLLSDDGSGELQTSADNRESCTSGSPCKPADDYSQIGPLFSDTFPVPAPGPSLIGKPYPTGSATFTSAFGGGSANGTWLLYANNWLEANPPYGQLGSWCLNFTMQSNAHPTNTSVGGSPNPASFTPPSTTASVTITANVSVSDTSGLTVDGGTVTFVDGATTLGTASVSNGQATLTTPLAEGTHQIVASYSGTDTGTEFGISTGTFDQRVDTATTNPTSASVQAGPYTFCNPGGITAPGLGNDSGPASPYPSNIYVTNLPGTVNSVTVTLNGFTTRDQGDLLSLLVGPGGNNFDFFSLTGSNVSTAPSPFNLTFSDLAASSIAEGSSGNLSSSGTFKPTSYNTDITFPQCPPNAPLCGIEAVGPPLASNPFTPTNKAATAGTAILGNADAAGVFGGTTSSTYNGNGTWSLYLDDGGPTGGGETTNVNGGWCVSLTQNLPTASATASHSGTFTQGQQGAPFTVSIFNNGPAATGDPTGGANPLTVTDTLNSAFAYAGFTGTGWSCSATGQTVACKNDSSVAQGSGYTPLTIDVNVSPTASTTTSIPNSISVSGGGVKDATSNTDNVTILPAAVLAVQKSHTGTFTQGQTAQWNIAVSNSATSGLTYGTIMMSDTLPTGYTLASYTSTGSAWSCSGTNVVTCTTTAGISGGADSIITLTVNVPATSPFSVTNTAAAWGGGDLTHTSLATAATSTDTATVAQAPQISSVTPNYGAPASPITITGTNFGATQGSSAVTVGGAPSYVASWSNTAVSILVPSRATTGNIVVTVGGVSSNGEPFTFYPYPAITGVSPLSGPVGTPVTITGTALLDGGGKATVTFNGTPATILSDTSTTITVDVPTGATTGPVDVRVNGIPLSAGTFTVISSQLSISSITPNYGAPAALIQIAGNGFGATQGGSVVTVGGAPSYVGSWSNTAISILVPSRATTGNIVVTVGGVSSNGEPFTFYPYPAITGISPISGAVGTPVTITGTSLLDGGNKATVTFNGTPAAIISDTSTTIMVDVPTGATTGPVGVRVNGIPLSAGTFTVTSPQLSSISPNYGAPAALIQIAGNGFGATQGNSFVTVGGAPSHIVSWSNTAIAIQVPSRATTGNIVVTVGGASSNGEPFTFYPYPAITGISPLGGPVGTPVTITGTALLDGGNKATVTFNGTPAAIISDTTTTIMVDVPTGATTGPVDLRVNGIPLSAGTFTVTSPQISSISPNYGAPAALIQIAGNGFGATQGNSFVTVGGAPSHIVSWSNTAIAIQVPSRATTGNIVVTVGGASSNGEPFTFYPYPAITGVSPLSGPVGTPVTITGTALLDGANKATVTFNGTSAAIIGDTSTTIMVDVPTGATTGPVDVRVNGIPINDAGSFTVSPSISIVPASVNVAAGGSIQFAASGGAGLVWEVNGITGGDAMAGVISASGLYTAPQSASTVTISAVDPSNRVGPGKASVSILAPHHFIVRTTSGLAQFYDRSSGNVFTPRGNNYVRLATLTDPDGSADYTHSTFSVGLYDSARAEAALTMMQASGYNVVRVFLWGCCDGTIGDPAGGLASAYIHNVVDFLQRAKTHAIGVIFTSQWLPVYGGYTDSLGACQPQFDDINLMNLSSCGVNATKKFFHDYVQALVNAGAPLDAIFAYDLWNEYYYNATAAPLNTTSGTVTTANGQTYDMSSTASQQQMMDDGLAYFADQNRSAILGIDPTALVTMSFFTPQGPNPTRIGDFRIIEVYPAVANSKLDYVDLHAYPIASNLTMDQFAENFGFVGYQQQKPILMGEFGAFTADYASVGAAATGLQGWQTQSCAYNFQGWLLWTWDTDEQTELWNALSQGGAINQSLSPAERLNPCSS